MYKLYITPLLLGFSSLVLSQGMSGLKVSAYSGIIGIGLQPANLASSPYSVDVNIIGVSATAVVKSFLPETGIGNTFYEGDQYSIGSMFTKKQENFFVNANVFMPSASYRIDEKSGLAFTWRYRVVAYGSVSNSSLSLFAENDFETKKLGDIPLIESMLGVANTWEEFGMSYGRNIYDKGRHKVDVGLSAKYLRGGASGYVEVNGVNADYDKNTNTLNEVEGKFSMMYNQEVDQISEGESTKLFNSSGFGMNVGVNYEYKSAKYLDKKTDRQNQPNYLFKVSTGFRDVGKIKFKASENSGSYTLTQKEPIDADYFNNLSSIDELSKRLENTFVVDTIVLSEYSLRLPTTWNFNIDWNIWKNFYGNFYMDFTGVQMRESFFRSEMLNQYKFSGRFEKAKYGFYTSLDYNKFSKWGSSISFRYSILYLGVNNLVKLSGDDTLNTLGVILTLRIPILSKGTTKKGRIF